MSLSWRWRQYGPSELWELLAQWHSVASQEACDVLLAFLQSVTEALFFYNFSWYWLTVKILTLYDRAVFINLFIFDTHMVMKINYILM